MLTQLNKQAELRIAAQKKAAKENKAKAKAAAKAAAPAGAATSSTAPAPQQRDTSPTVLQRRYRQLRKAPINDIRCKDM